MATGGSPWTLRIHYVKDGQTTGYYHQFRGSNVQVFNTTVMFLKDIDQTNGVSFDHQDPRSKLNLFSFFRLFKNDWSNDHIDSQ